MAEIDLSGALRLAWIAATAPIVVASLPWRPLGFLHRIVMGFTGRGKTGKNSSKKLTVPQSYFLHFYVLGLALTTTLLLSTWFYAYKEMLPLSSESISFSAVSSHLTRGSRIFSTHKSPSTILEHKYQVWQTVFVLLLMEVQVLRRLHETINVFHYSPSARMHICAYLTGLLALRTMEDIPTRAEFNEMKENLQGLHESLELHLHNHEERGSPRRAQALRRPLDMAPLSLSSCCAVEALGYGSAQIAEFIVKGRQWMPALEINFIEALKPLISLGWPRLFGAIIFFWGWLHQLRCHAILGSLRGNKSSEEYVIPHGDWFSYVSSPHYLAEMVIYFGVLIVSGGSDITVWLLFIFVVSNLVFAAAETHRWYHQKFEQYPKSRHAVIPFIY